jgi:cullin 1
MKPLISACESVLIDAHRQLLIDEFKQLLSQDKNEDLTRSFHLLGRIPNGLTPLKESFETHVKQVGLQAIDRLAQSTEQVFNFNISIQPNAILKRIRNLMSIRC